MSEGTLRTAAGYREAYRQVLDHLEALSEPLDAASFELPTGCPGWTVHDCVAHVAAVESMFIARELPRHQAPEGLPHVRSSFGAFMENGVDYRRSWSKEKVLAEYREVKSERVRRLEDIDDSDLDRDSQALLGTAKLRTVLAVRIFDIWTHEQDIRRATGQPGGFDGAAGRHARDRLFRGIARHLAESGVAPDGASLVVDITAPEPLRRGIVFQDGKGRVLDALPSAPSATLRLDMSTFTVLACGRADVPDPAARVVVEGDRNFASEVLAHLAFTP